MSEKKDQSIAIEYELYCEKNEKKTFGMTAIW